MGQDSPAAVLVDSEGREIKIVKGGDLHLLAVRDEEQLQVLHAIHLQLRKTNFYLAQLTDQELGDYDMEDTDG